MSGLRNLFGGSAANDSNEALKYSAPKEPKARQQDSFSYSNPLASTSGAPVSQGQAAATVTAPLQSSPAAPAAPAAAPTIKIMSSCAVRLYKINPTTNSYEPVEGGSALGCVIMVVLKENFV
jgi:hypothetical protein